MDRMEVIKALSDFSKNGICLPHLIPWKEINVAIAMLNELEPVKREIEGSASTWWYVCGECHGAVDARDKFCKHCGRPFEGVERILDMRPDGIT